MKTLNIQVAIEDSDEKIATAIKTQGYNKDKISDQLEILGIIENTKSIIQERIKKLGEMEK